MKEQRKKYLEIKEEQKRMRQEAISILGSSHSPPANHSVMNSHRRGGVPLYKQLEEKFLTTHEEEEKEKYQKALEERRRLFSNPTVSVNNLRQHWEEYKQQMHTKQ
jgi:hypothetical protein